VSNPWAQKCFTILAFPQLWSLVPPKCPLEPQPGFSFCWHWQAKVSTSNLYLRGKLSPIKLKSYLWCKAAELSTGNSLSPEHDNRTAPFNFTMPKCFPSYTLLFWLLLGSGRWSHRHVPWIHSQVFGVDTDMLGRLCVVFRSAIMELIKSSTRQANCLLKGKSSHIKRTT
jgi:hypothetical protein